ncbi:MAG TPA: molybdate ABC transporter substrate-binding protein, partial [Nitrospiraceae bacterium]|nr:molybdate ABC transporter substrate-binding protein [Nitrospiraceae bacterium]
YRLHLGALLLVSLMTISLEATPLPAQQPETLTIAAANSLRDAFREVLPLFEAQHPDIRVRVIYGPSQTLRKQIEEGAPVDVFLPSLIEEIEDLEKKSLLISGTKYVYGGTSLVLVTNAALPAPVGSIQDLKTIPIRRLAVGDPKTSSVGKVASQFLKYSQLDERLRSHYVYGEHSRAVLDLVAQGEAELGIVYRTDAVSNAKVRIVDTAPEGSHIPIHYGVAVVWSHRNLAWGQGFIEFLSTAQVQTSLQKHGFDRVSSDTGLAQRQEVKP